MSVKVEVIYKQWEAIGVPLLCSLCRWPMVIVVDEKMYHCEKCSRNESPISDEDFLEACKRLPGRMR